MKFLKVPNCIFQLGLAANEMKCYLWLLTCQNCFGTATVRVATIQQQCAIGSQATVQTALAGLESKGLITRTQRHGRDGLYISSKFTMVQLAGKWFKLNLSANPFQLDKSAFAVYLYLCQQRMPGGKACPSQSVIAAAIGMARHTVNDALQRLTSLGLILKAAVWKGKHSLYTVLLSRLVALFGENEGNKKELPPYPSAKTGREQPKGSSKTKYTVTRLIALVNRFFVNLTCAKIEEKYIDLTLTPKKEKKILTSRFTIARWERGNLRIRGSPALKFFYFRAITGAFKRIVQAFH